LGPLMLDRALLLTEGRSYRLIVSLGGEYFGPSAVSSSYSIELGVPPVCEADNDADGDVDVFDLLSYLDSWFNLDASAERTGDIPVSINVFDLLAYLDEWFAGC